MIIKYNLVDNPLTPDPNDFRAQVVSNGSIDMEQVIDACIQRGTMVTKTDLTAVLDLSFAVICDFVVKGYHVNTPLVNLRPLVKGVFTDEEEAFNREKHTLKPGISAGIMLRKKFETAPVERTDSKPVVPTISSFFDQKSGLKNFEVTPGGMGMLKGTNLNYATIEPDEGIFFVDSTGAETQVSDFLEVKPGKVSFSIPSTLAQGNYILAFRNRMASSTMREAKRPNLVVK